MTCKNELEMPDFHKHSPRPTRQMKEENRSQFTLPGHWGLLSSAPSVLGL